MWDRLSTTAGALRNQVGRLAEEALASAEEFSQQVCFDRAVADLLRPNYRLQWSASHHYRRQWLVLNKIEVLLPCVGAGGAAASAAGPRAAGVDGDARSDAPEPASTCTPASARGGRRQLTPRGVEGPLGSRKVQVQQPATRAPQASRAHRCTEHLQPRRHGSLNPSGTGSSNFMCTQAHWNTGSTGA